MQRCRINPYEGTEPYIFISYAHNDSELVFPVLEELDRRGYRIWYDDGIAPGSEWPENIAQHLNNCTVTMAFVSANSIASDNCRREITFALSKKKAFLAVILEPTQMSLGMEMQLSAQQCVMKYSYDTEEKFLGKICSCPDLAPCRKSPVIEPEQPHQEAPKTAVEQVPPKHPEPRPPKEGRTPTRKKWFLLGIPVVLAAAILMGVICAITAKVKITDKNTVGRKETYVYLSGETLAKENIERINKLGKLTSLVFQNCAFQEDALTYLKLDGQLTYLMISDCTGVDSFDFLNRQPNLKTLSLKNCSVSNDTLPVLELEKLTSLEISGNPSFTDAEKLAHCSGLTSLNLAGTGISSLEPIQGENLSELNFSDTDVSDVTPLAAWTCLTSVRGSRSMVQDIGPLAGLTKLTSLEFQDCGITNPEETFSCLRLNTLLLGGNRLTSLDAFQNCTILKYVDAGGNQIGDVSFLEKNVGTLVTLDLSENPLDGTKVAFLQDCENLTELHLDGIALGNLSFLENAASLEKLTAVGCGIQDISALAACTQLTLLQLTDNEIGDISALKHLASENWVTLDLGGNPLTDVSELPDLNYSVLCLVSEDLDIRTLPRLRGTNLVLYCSNGFPQDLLGDCSFSNYYFLLYPADKRVALEDLLGSFKVNYLDTKEELIDQMEAFDLDYHFLNE